MCLEMDISPEYLLSLEGYVFGLKEMKVVGRSLRPVWYGTERSYELALEYDGLFLYMESIEQEVTFSMPYNHLTGALQLGLHISPSLLSGRVSTLPAAPFISSGKRASEVVLRFLLDACGTVDRLVYRRGPEKGPYILSPTYSYFLVGVKDGDIQAVGKNLVAKKIFIPRPYFWKGYIRDMVLYTAGVVGDALYYQIRNVVSLLGDKRSKDTVLDHYMQTWEVDQGWFYFEDDSGRDMSAEIAMMDECVSILENVIQVQWKRLEHIIKEVSL